MNAKKSSLHVAHFNLSMMGNLAQCFFCWSAAMWTLVILSHSCHPDYHFCFFHQVLRKRTFVTLINTHQCVFMFLSTSSDQYALCNICNITGMGVQRKL